MHEPKSIALPFASWTIDRLDAHLNEQKGIAIARSRIHDILIAEGLRWRTKETWFSQQAVLERNAQPSSDQPDDGTGGTETAASRPTERDVDPDFAQKRGAIVRLYTDPPHVSVVVDLDEMGPVAAKTYPGQEVVQARPTTNGKPSERAKQEADYGRRGKGYVFGTLKPADGAAFTEN